MGFFIPGWKRVIFGTMVSGLGTRKGVGKFINLPIIQNGGYCRCDTRRAARLRRKKDTKKASGSFWVPGGVL